MSTYHRHMKMPTIKIGGFFDISTITHAGVPHGIVPITLVINFRCRLSLSSGIVKWICKPRIAGYLSIIGKIFIKLWILPFCGVSPRIKWYASIPIPIGP